MYSDLFLIAFPAVILLLLYVVSFHFSYQYFGVLYLTQEGVLLKAPFKRRIYILYTEILELGIDVGTTKLYQQAKNPTEVSAQDQPDLQFRPARTDHCSIL